MLRDVFQELKRRWLYLLLLWVVVALASAWYANKQVDQYVGKLTFIVDESSQSGGGMGSIVGRLGLGSLNPSGVNLERIVEFSKSEYLTRLLLRDTIYEDDRKYSLADYLIEDYYELKEQWKESPNENLKNFSGFSAETNMKDRTQGQIFKLLHGRIHRGSKDEGPLSELSFNAATGIFTITTVSTSEELSLSLANIMYGHLRDVYTLQAREKDDLVMGILEEQRDSVDNRLRQLTARYNREKDRRSQVALSSDMSTFNTYEREMLQTSSILQEATRNIEMTRFRLLTLTPAFRTIDLPFYPLSKTNTSMMRYVILGSFFAVFAGLVIIFSIVFFKNSGKDSVATSRENDDKYF